MFIGFNHKGTQYQLVKVKYSVEVLSNGTDWIAINVDMMHQINPILPFIILIIPFTSADLHQTNSAHMNTFSFTFDKQQVTGRICRVKTGCPKPLKHPLMPTSWLTYPSSPYIKRDFFSCKGRKDRLPLLILPFKTMEHCKVLYIYFCSDIEMNCKS